jgi:Zn finger protein HypA/HybF involved in hydrogenase expression
MRELQITQSILAKVLLNARELSSKRIKSVELVIGEIAELDQISIEKHWEEISRGTPAERAGSIFVLLKQRFNVWPASWNTNPSRERYIARTAAVTVRKSWQVKSSILGQSK